MYIVIGILAGIVGIQTYILWTYKRQVQDICRQLAFLIRNESNMIITHEIDGGGIGKLSELLNEFLAIRRKERKEYLEKERMIADTYTNLSHDIRTPLTSLDGYFQLMEASDNLDDQKRYMAIIQERIESLKEMLEELFTFTKLKNESYELELSRCCVNRILKETVFSYYEEWMRLEITPEIEITEEMLYMEGNEQGLRRVIQNIIKNGLDHGEKQIRIKLDKQELDGRERIVLKISNQLRCREEIDVSQVFERFYKADTARSKTSTGLGLSIARELVMRMKGEIEARVVEDEFCVEMRFPGEK